MRDGVTYQELWADYFEPRPGADDSAARQTRRSLGLHRDLECRLAIAQIFPSLDFSCGFLTSDCLPLETTLAVGHRRAAPVCRRRRSARSPHRSTMSAGTIAAQPVQDHEIVRRRVERPVRVLPASSAIEYDSARQQRVPAVVSSRRSERSQSCCDPARTMPPPPRTGRKPTSANSGHTAVVGTHRVVQPPRCPRCRQLRPSASRNTAEAVPPDFVVAHDRLASCAGAGCPDALSQLRL